MLAARAMLLPAYDPDTARNRKGRFVAVERHGLQFAEFAADAWAPDQRQFGAQFPSSEVANREFLPTILPTGNGSYSPFQRLGSPRLGL